MDDTLIERLEAASEGSRELDLAIARFIGHPAIDRPGFICAGYTGSLDAAITLVPEGWVESYQRRFDDTTLADCYEQGGRRRTQAEAATPALALCIAALRAQAGEKS